MLKPDSLRWSANSRSGSEAAHLNEHLFGDQNPRSAFYVEGPSQVEGPSKGAKTTTTEFASFKRRNPGIGYTSAWYATPSLAHRELSPGP